MANTDPLEAAIAESQSGGGGGTASQPATPASATTARVAPSLSSRPHGLPHAPGSHRKYPPLLRPPGEQWKPPGLLSSASGTGSGLGQHMPYSQPWMRQGQIALDNCVKHIAELKCMLQVRTDERDANLKLAQQTNELLQEVTRERTQLQTQMHEMQLEKESLQTEAQAARANAEKVTRELQEVTRVREQLTERLAATQTELKTAQIDAAGAKRALEAQSERFATMHATTMRAEAEKAAAEALTQRVEAERAAEVSAREATERAMEEERAANEAEAARAEEERKRRALCAVEVQDDTRELLEIEIAAARAAMMPSVGKGGKEAKPRPMRLDADGNVLTRFNDPEELLQYLEEGERGTKPLVTLLRASWLRAKMPETLPPDRSKLPAEAFISASELRKIYKQSKEKKRKLLPIITVLHPNSSPHAKGGPHPDAEGAIVQTVCEALDERWDQFTRKRGTGGDSGISELGVFFDWIAFGEGKSAAGVSAAAAAAAVEASAAGSSGGGAAAAAGAGGGKPPKWVQAFGLFYAHELVTVWMIPEKKDALSKQFDYTGGWAAAEHRLATLLKSTSDLSGYSGPWPQLLDLSEDIDSEHNERIHRPSPSEPLAFRTRHEFGTAAYVEGEDEREVVTHMYRDALVEMFTCAQALTFNRLGWLDTDASRLALLLPLGSQVQELHLSFNSIGDQGLFLLAQRMTQMVQLKVLNLAGNQIGDPGASRLSGALTEATALQSSLFNLDLGQNNIGDKGALALAASVGGDTKMALRKLNLKGNPLSPAAKKGVTKALKKQAKGGAPAATGR